MSYCCVFFGSLWSAYRISLESDRWSMPDPRAGTGEGGQHYQSTLRLVLTALLSVISVSALVAFLVLCYRSHWKAGVLRALPEDHRNVRYQKLLCRYR